MNTRLLVRAAAGFLLLLPLSIAVAAAGGSGYALLKLGISGEGVALADAMSASAAGAEATVYNPAGLMPAPGSSAEIQFTHRAWIQDVRMEFLGAAVAIGSADAIGFSLQSTTVGNIDIRTRPGPAEGSFTARTFVIGASYARSFEPRLRAGATVKMLYQKILVDDAAGLAFDLGVQFEPGIDGLSLGAALANLGTGGTLRTERTTLPAQGRLGAAYHLAPTDDITAGLMGDLLRVFPDKQTLFNVGAEIGFRRLVSLRGGYQFGSEGRGLAGGGGVEYGGVRLDYAYAPLSLDLGNTHTISLAVGF